VNDPLDSHVLYFYRTVTFGLVVDA